MKKFKILVLLFFAAPIVLFSQTIEISVHYGWMSNGVGVFCGSGGCREAARFIFLYSMVNFPGEWFLGSKSSHLGFAQLIIGKLAVG